MPFLLENPDRPELEIRREQREMLRKMVRTELQRTNELDPGHNEVKIEHLEASWRNYDRRELGLPDEEVEAMNAQLQFLNQIDVDAFANFLAALGPNGNVEEDEMDF